MAVKGQFNSDSNALKKRIDAHANYSTKDINDWIFEHIQLKEGMRVLDLGCGTGKQSIPVAKIIGSLGSITSVDISQDSLNALKQSASESGIKNILTKCADLDHLNSIIKNSFYDRVIGCYSLYYAKDYKKLLESIANMLNEKGILFYCGPSKDNNLELKKFHYSLLNQEVPPATEAISFMEDKNLVSSLFSKVNVFTFENPLQFNSPESLFEYWSSYNLFDEKLVDAFKKAAKKYFETNEIFETVKRVIGVQAIK